MFITGLLLIIAGLLIGGYLFGLLPFVPEFSLRSNPDRGFVLGVIALAMIIAGIGSLIVGALT